MAKFEFNCKCPVWSSYVPYFAQETLANGAYTLSPLNGIFQPSSRGVMMTSDYVVTDVFIMLPVATKLPKNSFEILVKKYRIYRGDGTSYTNTGGALCIRDSSYGKNVRGPYCYMATPGGTASSYFTAAYDSKYDAIFSLSKTMASGAIGNGEYYWMRFRREGTQTYTKQWRDAAPEPAEWDNTFTDVHGVYDEVSIVYRGYNHVTSISEIYLATNGDTAGPDPIANPTHESFGVLPDGFDRSIDQEIIVLFKDRSTGNIFDYAEPKLNNTWVKDIKYQKPYIIEIRGTNKSVNILPDGVGYLGGDYPDGVVTVDGVPTDADIEVRLKNQNPTLNGTLIASTKASQSGTWKIPNIDMSETFDIIARKEGEQPICVSDVQGEIDTILPLRLKGQYKFTSNFLSLRYKLIGTPPFTYSFEGNLPLAFENSFELAADNFLLSTYYSRDFGNFSPKLNVSDGVNSQQIVLDMPNTKMGNIATIIGTVGNLATTAANSRTLVIPATCLPGDILVLTAVHRATILTVTDTNSGVWESVTSGDAAVYQLFTKISYRVANATTAGSTITVTGNSSALLMVQLHVVRGKYAPLKVAKAFAGPARYDDTYSTEKRNLSPITGVAGFAIYALGYVYALTTTANNHQEILGMTNLGSVNGVSPRYQCGYCDVGDTSPLPVTVYVNTSDVADGTPHAYIVLDEIRL